MSMVCGADSGETKLAKFLPYQLKVRKLPIFKHLLI